MNKRVRRISLAILTELAVSTPVDTGRARANWVISLGRPPDHGQFPPFAEGRDGNTARANATLAIETGRAALSDRRDEQDVYISNNVPYIGRLNEGYSAQAPAGFIETAVANGVRRGSGQKVVE